IVVRDNLGNETRVPAAGISAIVFRGTGLNDSIDFSGLTLPIPVDARGGLGNDTLTGGAGNDLIRGGPGADVLSGRGGDDALYGDGGADTLAGDDGRDILIGGPDADLLRGGAGADTYLYGTTAGERGGLWGRDQVQEDAQITSVTDNGAGLIRVTAPGPGLAKRCLCALD